VNSPSSPFRKPTFTGDEAFPLAAKARENRRFCRTKLQQRKGEAVRTQAVTPDPVHIGVDPWLAFD
jgi:hypothetical protein